LLLQIVPQQVVVVHRGLLGQVGLGQLARGAVASTRIRQPIVTKQFISIFMLQAA
jgi:hypothetical protein